MNASNAGAAPCLVNMPVEMLNAILSLLSQRDLVATLHIHRDIVAVVKARLYHTPLFTSTYRFAQFSRIVQRNSHVALMVRVLDLSSFQPRHPSSFLLDRGDDHPEWVIHEMAGWREFQYFYADIYYINYGGRFPPPYTFVQFEGGMEMISLDVEKTLERHCEKGLAIYTPQGRSSSSKHPDGSPIFKNWAKVRDVPIGMLCRVLAACQRLTKIDISRLKLAKDSIILPPLAGFSARSFVNEPPSLDSILQKTESSPAQFPTSVLSPIDSSFGSDMPPPCHGFTDWHSRNEDTREKASIFPDEVMYWLTQLPQLETLVARECNWMTTIRAWTLLCEPVTPTLLPKSVLGQKQLRATEVKKPANGSKLALKEIDFTGCGGSKPECWSIKGTIETLRREVLKCMYGPNGLENA